MEELREAAWRPWSQLLQDIVVEGFLEGSRPYRKLVTLSVTQSVRDAIDTLARAHISAAPVVDEQGKYRGMVDNLDLLGMMLTLKAEEEHTLLSFFSNPFFDKPISSVISSSDLLQLAFRNLNLLPDESLRRKRLRELTDSSNNNNNICISPCISIRGSAIASDAFSVLYDNRVGGVAVVEGGKLVDNLSASDLKGIGTSQDKLAYFDRSVNEFLAQAKNRGKEEEGRRERDVVCCMDDATVEEVIRLLAEKRVHRAYVVDDQQRPIGVVSISDLLGLLLPPSLCREYEKEIAEEEKEQAEKIEEKEKNEGTRGRGGLEDEEVLFSGNVKRKRQSENKEEATKQVKQETQTQRETFKRSRIEEDRTKSEGKKMTNSGLPVKD
ncbi:hypothetical protein QOT17_014952 [Balamuthia mandrillaris]